MRATLTCLICSATFLAACAANPKPGEPGYPYNLDGPYQVEVVVDGTPYRGMMELTTAPGGSVNGSFMVTAPVHVDGTVEGAIVADTLDFRMPYAIQENGCVGVVTGRGGVTQGGGAFSGPVALDDSCGGAMNGTITIQR
jgi:hypothetical protein